MLAWPFTSLLGKSKAYYQKDVAKSMAAFAGTADPAPSFIVSVGDNFYDNGVQSVSDSMWSSLWRNIYHGAYPELKMPWYSVLGNHDYGYGSTGVQAQIDRTDAQQSDDNLWNMPATNYSRTFATGDGATVTIVFIDSTTLAPSENKCCNSKGGVSTSEQASRISNQLGSIDRMLQEATLAYSTWLVVIGHYPVYSSGEHSDTSEMVSYLDPLLRQYNVHAYICGHDHVSEHLQKNGIEYFVAGAGSMADSMGASSAASLSWYSSGTSAFASVLVTAETFEVSFINTAGQTMYEYALTNANPMPPTGFPSPAPNATEPYTATGTEDSALQLEQILFFFLGAVVVASAYLLVQVVRASIRSCKRNHDSPGQVETITHSGGVYEGIRDVSSPTASTPQSTAMLERSVVSTSTRSYSSNEPLVNNRIPNERVMGKYRKFNSIA